MQWLLEKGISHRGLYTKDICENSMSAFSESIKQGFAIELDVQMTKDKQLIVFHDENSCRLTNKSFDVVSSTYDDLQELTLLNTQDTIPLLQDVLALVAGKVPLLIEIKTDNFTAELESKVASLLENYQGEVAVCSFNYLSVKWFSLHHPHILRGLNFGDIETFSFKDFLRFLYYFDRSEPNFVSLDYALLESIIVKYCRFFKIPMLCWTIDSEEKKEKALKYVQNIIFEQMNGEW